MTPDRIKHWIIFALALIVIALIALILDQRINHASELKSAEKLSKALSDSLHISINKQGELEYEKRTIQASFKELSKFNDQLTTAQKELLDRVKKLEKSNQVIAAATIDMSVKVNGLIDNKPVKIDSNSVTFARNTDSLKYDLKVSNIHPIEFKIPSLSFNKLEFPNKQFISFQFKTDKKGKKEDYPITFSVTNSNPYFKVNNIESYAIETLKKQELRPTIWNKLGKLSKTTGGKIVTFSLGLGAGYMLFKK